MKIDFTNSPSNQDLNFLTEMINAETKSFGAVEPFAFYIRNDKQGIIAGCNGLSLYGNIYTDQLWVHTRYRKQGLGRKLLEAAENYGRSIGCKAATLVTMSFQKAQNFYEKHGYIVEFEREGYEGNSSMLFLKKVL